MLCKCVFLLKCPWARRARRISPAYASTRGLTLLCPRRAPFRNYHTQIHARHARACVLILSIFTQRRACRRTHITIWRGHANAICSREIYAEAISEKSFACVLRARVQRSMERRKIEIRDLPTVTCARGVEICTATYACICNIDIHIYSEFVRVRSLNDTCAIRPPAPPPVYPFFRQSVYIRAAVSVSAT